MPRAKKGRAGWSSAYGVTPAQLREAERALRLTLARKFSAAWIAQHHRDLLGQANTEYAEWLQDNPPARSPVGWLVNCAYWRAVNTLDSETRRPKAAPLESVAHLADEHSPNPEQVAVKRDRQHRLGEALSHLGDEERRLLTLVYFEDQSIREAGRTLGLSKSAADRHHAAAMKKMVALVGDRDLLAPAGPALLIALRRGLALMSSAASSVHRRTSELARRFAPITDAGGTAVPGGAARAAAQCGAAAAIALCGIVAAPGIQQGVKGLLHIPQKTQRPGRHRHSSPVSGRSGGQEEEVAPPPTSVLSPLPPRTAPPSAGEGEGRHPKLRNRAGLGRSRAARRSNKRSDSNSTKSSTEEAVPPEEAAPETEVAPLIEPAPAPEPSAPASPPPATGAQVNQEFGH